MRLYHSPRTRSARVLWVLEELEIPYDVTVLTVDERRGSEHRARHPLGRVPVLELDDGREMFESAAICLYLADQHPESHLAPSPESEHRPAAYQWLFFAMTELEPAVTAWRRAHRDGADEAAALAHLREVADAVSDALFGGLWLLGAPFSVVDIVVAKIWEPMLGTSVAGDFPTLAAHVERAQLRPAYARAGAADTARA